MSQSKLSPDHKSSVWLFLILTLGFILRTWRLNPVYISSDHVQWVYACLNIFNNRSLFSPELGNNLLAGIFSFPYGFVTLTAFYLFAVIFGLFNIPLNEITMSLPVAIFGTITVLFVYLLVKEYSNRKTALFAALIIAIEPFLVIESRDPGRMHTVSALCLGIMTLYFFTRYFSTRSKKLAILSQLSLGLYLGSSNIALGIIPVIFLMAFILGSSKDENFKQRLINTFRLIFKKEIILFPLFILCIYLFSHIYAAVRLKTIYTGFLGKTLRETKIPGIYILNLIRYYIENCGIYLTLLMPLGAWLGFKKFIKGDKLGIIFFWVSIYIAPFIFLAHPSATVIRVYVLESEVGLLILGIIALFYYFQKLNRLKDRLLYKIYFRILLFSLAAVTLFTTLCLLPGKGLPAATKISGVIKDMGNLQWEDTGIKAAGYFIRENSSADDKIFTDTELFQSNYYFGKKLVYSSYDWANTAEILAYFDKIGSKMDFIVINSEIEKNIDNILNGSGLIFYKTAGISGENKQRSIIYSKRKIPFLKMNAFEFNKLFDKKYGKIQALVPELAPWPQPDRPIP